MSNQQDIVDIQMLAHIVQLAHRRERCLAQAVDFDQQLSKLRANCTPRLRRTIDRLTLIDSTRLNRPDQYEAGRDISSN